MILNQDERSRCYVLQGSSGSAQFYVSDVADSRGGIIPPHFAVQNSSYSGQ